MTALESKLPTVPENGPEDGFVYAAVEVFSIISPYVFHTHAPRVFSEISAALKRAQEASAEVIAQLNASEKAQTRERVLRSMEVNRHLAQLKELQALLKARADKEAEINKRRTSLERKLTEEKSRSAGLEKRLAESDEHVGRLQEEFLMAKIALDEQWRCALAEAVVAGKEAGREEVAAKVEATLLKRMRILSSENSSLKAKLKASKVQSANLQETVLSRFRSSDSERTSSLSPGASSRASGSKFSFASRESSPRGPKSFDGSLPPLLPRVPKTATGDEGNTNNATSAISAVGPAIEMGPEIEGAAVIEEGRECAESRSGFVEAVMELTERGSGIAGKVLGFAERGLAIFPRASEEQGEEEACKSGREHGSRNAGGKEEVAPGGIGRGSTSSSDLRVRQLRRIATWTKADAASRRTSSSDEQDGMKSKSMKMMSSKTGTPCRDEHGVRKRGLGAFPHLAKGPRSHLPPSGGSVDGDSTAAAVSGASLSACLSLLGNEPADRRPRSFSATPTPLASFHSGRGSSGSARSGRRWQRSLGAGSNSPSLEALLASGKFYSEGSVPGRGRRAGATAPLPLGRCRRRAGGGVGREEASVVGEEDGDNVVDSASAEGVTTDTPAGVGAGGGLEHSGALVDASGLACTAVATTAASTVGGEGFEGFSAGPADPAAADDYVDAADAAGAAGGNGERESGEAEKVGSTNAYGEEFTGNGATTRPHPSDGGEDVGRAASGDGSRSVTSTSEALDVPDAEKSLDDLLREMAVINVGEQGFTDSDSENCGGGDDAWLVEEGGGGEGFEAGVDKVITKEAGLAMGAAPLKRRGRVMCV